MNQTLTITWLEMGCCELEKGVFSLLDPIGFTGIELLELKRF